jgi:hypothetical protein
MTKNWKQAKLDIDFILDSGLLFEINRQFMHPLGIAMTVRIDENGQKTWAFKDYREEPESVKFDNNTLTSGRLKYETFMKAFGFAQMAKRERKLGVSTQHVDCWTK